LDSVDCDSGQPDGEIIYVCSDRTDDSSANCKEQCNDVANITWNIINDNRRARRIFAENNDVNPPDKPNFCTNWFHGFGDVLAGASDSSMVGLASLAIASGGSALPEIALPYKIAGAAGTVGDTLMLAAGDGRAGIRLAAEQSLGLAMQGRVLPRPAIDALAERMLADAAAEVGAGGSIAILDTIGGDPCE
jgi:hypothetical protein